MSSSAPPMNEREKQAHLAKVREIVAPQMTCPNCKKPGTIIEDYKHGSRVCQRCGTVVGGRIINDESEWRSFSSDKGKSNKPDQNRVGAAESIFGKSMGLSTLATGPGADAVRSRLESSEERRAKAAAMAMKRMGGQARLSRMIVDRAMELFCKLEEEPDFKTRRNQFLMAACMYIACQLEDKSRTLDELCLMTGLKKKRVGKVVLKVKKTGVYTSMITSLKRKKPGQSLRRLAPRAARSMAAQLELPFALQRTAVDIASRATDLNIGVSRKPQTMAAAAILFASRLPGFGGVNLEWLELAAQKTAATIESACRELEDRREQVLKGVNTNPPPPSKKLASST